MPDHGNHGTAGTAERIRLVAHTLATSQHEMVVLAAEFADSGRWALDGAPSAAHWLAEVADVEACTAREWIRIGRQLRELPLTMKAFSTRRLSYSKVRTLTRVATPDNEAELVVLCETVSATDLGRTLAAWMGRNSQPDDLERHQHQQRSVKWRNEPDGMVTFTLRLPPLLAGILIAVLTRTVMKSRAATTAGAIGASADAKWPTVAQQNADALHHVLTDGIGPIATEVVLHVRGDGATMNDGTPVPESVVNNIAPTSFIRALIHDIEGKPVDASNRRRHPTTRQRRVVKERDQSCVDCGRADLLEFDHVPDYETSGHTITSELQLRCAPCHHKRHRNAAA